MGVDRPGLRRGIIVPVASRACRTAPETGKPLPAMAVLLFPTRPNRRSSYVRHESERIAAGKRSEYGRTALSRAVQVVAAQAEGFQACRAARNIGDDLSCIILVIQSDRTGHMGVHCMADPAVVRCDDFGCSISIIDYMMRLFIEVTR